MFILIVEDNIKHAQMMQYALPGHDSEIVATVADAMDAVLARRPDLFLIDIALPGNQDGVDLIHLLRDDATTRQTPIIVITAVDTLDTRRRSIAAGIDAYLAKPWKLNDLRTQVQQLLA